MVNIPYFPFINTLEQCNESRVYTFNTTIT